MVEMAEAQTRTAEAQMRTAEAQARTEASLAETNERLNALIDTVECIIIGAATINRELRDYPRGRMITIRG